MNRTPRLTLSLLAVVTLTHCECTPSPTPPEDIPVVALIGAAGGELTSSDGRITLDVPPGALDEELAFVVERAEGAPAGANGPVYDIGPSGTEFLIPARVTYRLTNLQPDEPRVATYEDDEWLALASQILEVDGAYVSGETSHLSLFSMVAGVGPNPNAVCGDLACNQGETCSDCPSDCGPCAQCGNDLCDDAENCESCEADCGVCVDSDGDGLFDHRDNCPYEANDDQADEDSDGFGDICERPHTPFGTWPESHPTGRVPLVPYAIAPAYEWLATDAITETSPGWGTSHDCSGRTLGANGEPAYCLYPTCAASFAAGAFSEFAAVRAVADENDAILLLTPSSFANGETRVLRLTTTNDQLEVAFDQALDLGPLEVGLNLASPPTSLLVENALLTRTDDGRQHLVVAGRVSYLTGEAGNLFSHNVPVVLGLSPTDFSVQWGMKAGAPNASEPGNAPLNLVVFPDGRIVVAVDPPDQTDPYLEYIRVARDVYATTIPASGVFGAMRKISPLSTAGGTTFRPRLLSRDDEGNLYVLGNDPVRPGAPVCFHERDVWMVRVYDEQLNLVDERDVDAAFEAAAGLFVTPEVDADGNRETVVRVIGDPADANAILKDHYHQDPTQFSENPDDPVACPEEFRNICEPLTEACPCRACTGGSFTTTLGTGRRQKHTRLVQITYSPGADSSVVYQGTKAFDFSPMRDHPNPGEMAFDGRGKLMTLTGLYDTRALTPQSQRIFDHFGGYSELEVAGRPFPDADSFLFDAPGEDSDGRFVGVMRDAKGARNIVVGRSGERPQYLSRAPTSDIYTRFNDRGAWLLPLGNGRLLFIKNESETLVVQLARPTDAIPDDVLLPPADAAMPDVGPETRHRLGVVAEEEATSPSWIYCVQYDSTINERTDCDLQELQREWEKTKEEEIAIALAVGSGQRVLHGGPIFNDRLEDTIQVQCLATETEPRNLGQTSGINFRCPQWEEVYEAGQGTNATGTDVVSTRPTPIGLSQGQCDFFGRGAPLRAFNVHGKSFDVVVTDASGETVVTAEVGDTLTVGTDELEGASSVEVRVVEGSGTLAGGDANQSVTLAPGETVDLTVTGEGVIVIEVTTFDASGKPGAVVRTVIFIDGPSECGFDPDGVFSSCNTRLPIAFDSPAFESFQTPATAGAGVLLHDRSYKHTQTDLEVPSIGMPFRFQRTHRSAHVPDDGGLMGGWTFSYDQRLVQVEGTDSSVTCHEDPAGAGPLLPVAFWDGMGRVDTFAPPAPSDIETIDFDDAQTLEEAYVTYNHATDTLEKRTFRARVATYPPAPGRFETLKAYTLVDTAPGDLSSAHPWFAEAGGERGAIGRFETRFYELTEPGGTKRIFNCRGQLARIVGPRFHEMEFLYGGGAHPTELVKLLTGIIDTTGRRYELEWDNQGPIGRSHPRLTKLTDPFGRELLYAYASGGEFGAVLEAARFSATVSGETSDHVVREWRYTYDDAGRLLTTTRADGELELTNLYDEAGAIAQQVFGVGTPTQDRGATESFRVDFSDTAGGVRVVDGRGTEWDYALGQAAESGAQVVTSLRWQKEIFNGDLENPGTTDVAAERTWLHDADGLVLSYTNEAGVTRTTEYNEAGTEIARTESAGPGGGHTLSWRFDVEPTCQTIVQTEDPSGRVSTWESGPFALDAPGWRCRAMTRTRETAVASPEDPATNSSWSDTFEIIESGPTRGLLRRHAVLKDGVVEREFELEFTSDANTQTEVSPAGKRLRPKLGQLVQRTDRGRAPDLCTAALPAELVATYETDVRGNVLEERVVNPAGDIVVQRRFDEADRMVEEIRDPLGHAATMKNAYDLNDQITAVTWMLEDNFAETHVPAAPSGEIVERRHYDRLGRHFGTHIDGEGNNQWFVVSALDANGEIVERVRPGPGIDISTALEIVRGLEGGDGFVDVLGDHPIADASNFLDDRGAQLVMESRELDASGDVLRETLTDGLPARNVNTNLVGDPYLHSLTTTTLRDVAGNILFEDNGRTDRDTFTLRDYDGNQRLLSERVHDEACPSNGVLKETRIEGLDVDGNPSTIRTFGTRAHTGDATTGPPAACEAAVELSFQELEYDTWGRLLRVTENNRPLVPDLAANLTDFHATHQRVTTTTHDDRGRERLRIRGDATSQLEYTFFDRVCAEKTALTSPVATSELKTFGFDARAENNLIREEHRSQGVTGLDVTSSLTVDALGRVTAQTDDTGMATRFFYDSLDRLRAQLSPRFEIPYSNAGVGQFEIREYDAVSNVKKKTHRAVTVGGVVAERHQEYDWRSGFVTQVEEYVEGDIRHTTSYVGDAVGNQVKVFVHGRGFDEDYATYAFNEAGHLVEESRVSGTSVVHEVDGLGRTLESVATPPTNAGAGYADATVITQTMRYDSLGGQVYAQDNSARQDHAVAWRRDAFGNPLEEESENGSVIRSTYDELGNRTALFYPGATPDVPELAFEYDALGRARRIDNVGNTGSFDALDEIEFEFHGGVLAEKRTRTDSGESFVSTYDYNEVGQKYRVRHYRGALIPGNLFLESRAFFYGPDLAGTATFPVNNSVEQGQGLQLFTDLQQASTVSHLSDWPQSASDLVTYDTFPGNPWPSVYRLLERSPFGDVVRQETVSWRPVSGRASIEFTWKEYDGLRLSSEQSMSWLGENDPGFYSDGEVLDWRYTELTPRGQSGRYKDRTIRKMHRSISDPPDTDPTQYPKPSNYDGSTPVESQRSYAFTWTQENKVATYGLDATRDTLGVGVPPNDFQYDAFDRLISVEDFQSEAFKPGVPQLQPERMHQLLVFYDALGRRSTEVFQPEPAVGPAGSRLPSEKARDFTYLDNETLEETNYLAAGGELKDRFIPVEGQLPYVDLHFGEHIVFEDVQGGFAGLFDVDNGEFAALTSASAEELALKPQPYVVTESAQAAAFDPGILDFFTSALMMPFPQVPQGQTFFRRTGPNSEEQPFFAMSYTPGAGYQFRLAEHPHYNQEMQRLALIQVNQAVWISAALIVVSSVIPIVPGIIGNVLWGALFAYDVYQAAQIYEDVRFNGWTSNSALSAFSLGLSFSGTGATVLGRVKPKPLTLPSKAARIARNENRIPGILERLDGKRSSGRDFLKRRRYERVEGWAPRIERRFTDRVFFRGRRLAHDPSKSPIEFVVKLEGGVREMRRHMRYAFRDAGRNQVAIIGRDSKTVAGDAIPNPVFETVRKRLNAQFKNNVSSIKSFVGYDSENWGTAFSSWSPHLNLAWVEGIAHARTPVILGSPLAEFGKLRPHGLSFMTRELIMLARRGYRFVPMPAGQAGYGLLMPPPLR